jgi:hypothetical protein
MFKPCLLLMLLALLSSICFAQNKCGKILSYKVDVACDTIGTQQKDSIALQQCNHCKSWHYPSKAMVQKIISHMKVISTSEHHGLYADYPCSIHGVLLYNHKQYHYYLNAGGHVALVAVADKEDKLYLGCEKGEYDKYFLTTRFSRADY